MSTITTRAGKGSPLTNTEVDDNFTNLNTDKLEDITSESLADLSDVSSTTPTNGQVLAFNTTSSSWEPQDSAGGDLVDDTTPQLGGDLDVNGFSINLGDGETINVGDSNDFTFSYDGTFNGLVIQTTVGGKFIQTNAGNYYIRNTFGSNENYITADAFNTKLYHLGTERVACDTTGVKIDTAYYLPTADGTAGQVITTDGSGTLSFADAGGGASALDDLSDAATSPGFQNLVLLGTAPNLASGAVYNVIVGSGARDLTEGDSNTMVGTQSGGNVTTGSQNVCIGLQSMSGTNTANVTGNIAVGYRALYGLGPGNFSDATNNIGIGQRAGDNITTGSENIVIGDQADASSGTVDGEITIGNSDNTRFRLPGLQAGASDGDVMTYNATDGIIELAAPSGGGGGGGLSQGKAIILAMVFG